MLEPLATGQSRCYDESGNETGCAGSGQDAEFARRRQSPVERFEAHGGVVLDRLTGLTWLQDAAFSSYPLSWQESLNHVAAMNHDGVAGHDDWRLPNRRELRSLVCHDNARPALPHGHPFGNVVQTWYWTSTSAAINPAYAWYINLEGARMFYGAKNQYFMAWPVRGRGDGILPATGQSGCFGIDGTAVPCGGSGQDGELRLGVPLPEPRFYVEGDIARDRLTGLEWMMRTDLTGGPTSWNAALAAVAGLERDAGGGNRWRLPDINELESLVDCGRASPALAAGHPFRELREAYWSSTTSVFEPDWAWALYLQKGACGVGRKNGRYYHVWPVRDPA